ncbi:hypothetical protein L596_021330 [Steinernema carpocapsae]|uniref:Uncharacterized protein n=1 Tax=Steinernema carpocapsae TaxID=34508 RepID=A0A4U5MIF8_STECR|nr:hypothetical protein L596_021330 [Steinernema carpocapsae]
MICVKLLKARSQASLASSGTVIVSVTWFLRNFDKALKEASKLFTFFRQFQQAVFKMQFLNLSFWARITYFLA